MLDRKLYPDESVPLSYDVIREEAHRFQAHFKDFDDEHTTWGFEASESRFRKFKLRQSLRSIKIVGKTVCAESSAASIYLEEF